MAALGLERAEMAAAGPTSGSAQDRGEGSRWKAKRAASAERFSGRGRGSTQMKKAPEAVTSSTSARPGRRSIGSMAQGRPEPSSLSGVDEIAGLNLEIDADLGGRTIDTPPPAYEDVLTQSKGTDEQASVDEDSAQVSPTDGDEANGVSEPAERGVGDGGGGGFPAQDAAARQSAATAAEEENARLRSELEVFDLGFFEEVEDLKYSYATLKREAEKLAKKQGVDLAASLGLPEDGEEPWDRTVDMAHHSVDWAETAKRRPPGSPSSPSRGAHAARLAKQWNRLSSGLNGEEEGGSEGEPGFPVGSHTRQNEGPTVGARSLSDISTRRSGAGARGREASATPRWNGLIAAHERKLAWELSTGGMGSLACLREHIGRVGRSGDGFGSDEEVFSALRQSGYALELEDVAVLRTGLGSSADGKVDLEEFMTVCEDVASGEEWYVPAAAAVGEVAVLPKAVAMMMRSPDTLNGTASWTGGVLPPDLFAQEGGGQGRGGRTVGLFGSPADQPGDAANGRLHSSARGFSSFPAGLPGAEPLYLGGTTYGDRSFLEPSKNAEAVLAELKDQLRLLDMDRFFPRSTATRSGKRGGGAAGLRDAGGRTVTLGQAVGVKFSRRDPSQSGLLSARELGLALEDVGVSLHPDEVVTLAKRFKPPGGKQEQVGAGNGSRLAGVPPTAVAADSGGLDGVAAEYAPLVRLVVDCLAEASGVDPAVGGRARLGQRGLKWNERMPAPAKRLKAALAAGAEGGGWLERLRQRLVLLVLGYYWCLWGWKAFVDSAMALAVVPVCRGRYFSRRRVEVLGVVVVAACVGL